MRARIAATPTDRLGNIARLPPGDGRPGRVSHKSVIQRESTRAARLRSVSQLHSVRWEYTQLLDPPLSATCCDRAWAIPTLGARLTAGSRSVDETKTGTPARLAYLGQAQSVSLLPQGSAGRNPPESRRRTKTLWPALVLRQGVTDLAPINPISREHMPDQRQGHSSDESRPRTGRGSSSAQLLDLFSRIEAPHRAIRIEKPSRQRLDGVRVVFAIATR